MSVPQKEYVTVTAGNANVHVPTAIFIIRFYAHTMVVYIRLLTCFNSEAAERISMKFGIRCLHYNLSGGLIALVPTDKV